MTANLRRWKPDFRAALQQQLTAHGLYNGRVDGEIGADMVDAIRTFAQP